MTQPDQIDWNWNAINLDHLKGAFQAYIDAAKALAPQYAEVIGYNDEHHHDDQCSFDRVYRAEYDQGDVTVVQTNLGEYGDDDHCLTIPCNIIDKHLRGEEWLDDTMKQAAIKRAAKAVREAEEALQALQAKQAEAQRIEQAERQMLAVLKARYE